MPRGTGGFKKGFDPRRGAGGNLYLDKKLSVVGKTLVSEDKQTIINPLLVRPKKGDLWYPTEERLDLIYQLAVCGNSDDAIARIGCATDEAGFMMLITQYPDIPEIIKDGRAAGEAIAAQLVLNAMLDPNNKCQVQIAQFYLKVRRGWSDTVHIKADIPLPGHNNLKDLSNEDLDKLLENHVQR